MHRKAILLTVGLGLLSLTGCQVGEANSTELAAFMNEDLGAELTHNLLEDGIYFANENTFNEEGWKNTVTFEVVDGEIIEILFNSIPKFASQTKRDLSLNEIYVLSDEESNEASLLSWHQQMELLQNHILLYQTPDGINVLEDGTTDTIENITIEIHPFIELMNQALATGPSERGLFIDGYYHAEDAAFEDGLQHFINLIIENGYIVAVHWNALTEEGIRKYEPIFADSEDLALDAALWREQASLLEQHLISIQDPTLITYNAENQTYVINGVEIEVNRFVELAVQALANGPVILEN